MKAPEDDALIERAKNGDLGAFKLLVEKHESTVAGVVKSMLGDTAEARDVGQDVFIRFYEALDQYRGEAQVATYLTRIVINLSLNELKRRKKSLWFFSADETAASNTPAADSRDLQEALQDAFLHLAPPFRAVATLRLVEGYSTNETAALLGIPAGTVLSRLVRAQKKLRERLIHQLNQP